MILRPSVGASELPIPSLASPPPAALLLARGGVDGFSSSPSSPPALSAWVRKSPTTLCAAD
eukprot:632163-Alexandrium_andersonii.AAC.1